MIWRAKQNLFAKMNSACKIPHLPAYQQIKHSIHKLVIFSFLLLVHGILPEHLVAQIAVITDDSTYVSSISSALLELKSNSKGLLISKVSLAQRDSIANPADGLLVYQQDTLEGFYFFKDNRWEKLSYASAGASIPFLVTGNRQLNKEQQEIMVKNSVVLTLPTISEEDDGLTISVRHIGAHTDLVKLIPKAGSLVNGTTDTLYLTRWKELNFFAFQGDWYPEEPNNSMQPNILDVSATDSWQNIEEALEFLQLHMRQASTISLGPGNYDISSTRIINLPYPLSITGTSFGTVNLMAADGLQNLPMFTCYSETFFKMLQFDASTLVNYGKNTGEDAIQFYGKGVFYDLNELRFSGFYNAVSVRENAQVFILNNFIQNSQSAGVALIAGDSTGAMLCVSSSKFISNQVSLDLVSGKNATVSVSNGGFFLTDSMQTVIRYNPSGIAPYNALTIMGNFWNNLGSFLDGFDFSREDGRDANVYIRDNVNSVNYSPSFYIDVVSNGLETNLPISYNWYKATWENTEEEKINWLVDSNRVEFLTASPHNLKMTVTGNIIDKKSKSTLKFGFVKNGDTSSIFGETTIFSPFVDEPFQFSLSLQLINVKKGDYFELFVQSNQADETLVFVDINWLAESW